MTDRIIAYSFYLLFFLTPLFWTSKNYELFEYNKMILVYGFTVIIVGAWALKTINDKRLTIKCTPLDIPLLLFLLANILSTIFSIDPHTSIWGYYSRSNGGLLSLISYLLLFYAFVSNMDFSKALTTLKFGLASGFLISLYAIFEHFGVSPSCVILRGEFNADCWIQRVQERVFATLGQPNWLAAYLAMLIFPALYFLLSARTRLQTITYYLLTITYYLAFTFTYSRGPTLGLIGGIIVFVIALLNNFKFTIFNFNSNLKFQISNFKTQFTADSTLKNITVVFLSFLLVNLLFGSALTSFRLVSKFAAPARPTITVPTAPSGTQLENGGTESGQIRLIVWKGALDIFEHYPLFGSGLETFAYSYYQYRPAEHNLTSEWDFLYNKAHNEYLNYLSTTGIIGFGTYMLIIGTFIWWGIKQFKIQNSKFKITNQNLKLNKSFRQKTTATFDFELLTFNFALLAAYVSYLIYNFFLFSVVIIAVFFYLFPAFVFVSTGTVKNVIFPKKLFTFNFSLLTYIYHRPLYTKAAYGIVVASTLYLLFSIFQLWYADTVFNSGEKASDSGNIGTAYNLLSEAAGLNPGEPFYRSELAFSAAASSAALKETDATLSASLKDEALLQTQKVLNQSPNNVSFWRTAIRTYFELAILDNKYIDSTLKAIDYTIKLAPTDPKLYYNRALVLQAEDKKTEAIQALQKALKLKPNYQEVIDQLKQATTSGGTR